ncbi:alcohol dehydrogenase protein superfamily/ zinc-type [Synechococcus sp. PROS-9-1]|uniref:zinc-binding dehydrogenase n=1 Tax=Synechococcus sp. PROS-9-1 TaxID=1968775 RepID=UPI00164601E8|nr:zinc-binding dehydrogenase [Synechococcus sp. PROS-9-1]QNJ30601.1 alcohol dehydrogenase protein superfamily/ zinc-type [Synechococcus sp. PROS-9-1]
MNRPFTTEAAILVAQKQPLVVETIELPAELDVGQVLVQLQVSGICGSQLGEIAGAKGPDRYLPHLMGHEGFATVLDTGPGVKQVLPGDSVVLHWRPGAGIQADPPKYRWRGEQLNAGWVTTFNRHAVVSENRCTRVPGDTDPDAAALFGCAVTTGFGVVENNAGLRMGEAVVVFGAGGIGLNIIQAACLRSASVIIAVDLFDSRLDLARQLGATHVINSNREDAETAIQDALSGQPLDVFIDNTGLPAIIEQGYRLTHSQGRVILVGVPRQGNKTNLYTLPLHFGKILTGSHGGESKPAEDIPRYLRLLQKGQIQFHRLVSARYSLEEINSAIDAIRDGSTAGRVMIDL